MTSLPRWVEVLAAAAAGAAVVLLAHLGQAPENAQAPFESSAANAEPRAVAPAHGDPVAGGAAARDAVKPTQLSWPGAVVYGTVRSSSGDRLTGAVVFDADAAPKPRRHSRSHRPTLRASRLDTLRVGSVRHALRRRQGMPAHRRACRPAPSNGTLRKRLTLTVASMDPLPSALREVPVPRRVPAPEPRERGPRPGRPRRRARVPRGIPDPRGGGRAFARLSAA